ncbi:hypothetical protein [Saccharolobus shibatae]|uniref:Uncharacterized protein n=1 Tax=Saccharolobus shibatae TaxID=2286 RepID=A0A8F5C1G8_9CREN|nr:hypothetical protein J5U22_01981 [Saccharolobus shibatae]
MLFSRKSYSKIYTDSKILTWDANRFLQSVSKIINDLIYNVKRFGEPWTSILNEVILPFEV